MTTTQAKPTPKQRQVLGLLRQGRTPSEVAKRMHTSSSNVHGHIRRMRQAGIEVPAATNGHAETTLSTPGTSEKEERARQALMELLEDARRQQMEIDERCARMQQEVDQMKAEREVLDTKSERYAKAIEDLTA